MGRVVVLGSINRDFIAVCERHPERGESVRGMGLLRVPGGKGANQALASRSAGAVTVMIGAVGSDQDGDDLVRNLEAKGVDTGHVAIDQVPTGTASIFVDLDGEISVVAVPGANNKVVDDLTVAFEPGDVLVSQPEVPVASIHSFFTRGKSAGCTTVLNASPPSPLPVELTELTDICVVNSRELAALVGVAPNALVDDGVVVDAARTVQLADDGRVLVLGRGSDVLSIGDDYVDHIEGTEVRVVDTTGVEDCFVGSLAATLAGGARLEDALQYAGRAAALASTRRGASMPSRREVLDDSRF